MQKAQILILSVPHGTAHERLGLTIKRFLQKARPGIHVEVIDALTHCSKWFRTYYNSYRLPLQYWPALWGWIEGYQHTHTATGPGWVYRLAAKQLSRLISFVRPHVVVATEVGLCELAALIKKHEGLNFRLAAVPTGFDTDRPWVQPEVDLYIVDPYQVAPFLRAQGLPNSKIHASGVPVDPSFGSIPNRRAVREKLGLESHLPVILILFGGTGIGKPLRMIRAFKKVQTPLQTVWIAGRNRNLRRRLERQIATHDHSHVLGWTANMHEWMAASDLMLGKPGSSTLLEAMHSGLPILAFDPLPGIERRACDLIETWQIGRWIRHPEALAEIIDDFLNHPEKLQKLRGNALNRIRPEATQLATQAILELLPSGTGQLGSIPIHSIYD